MTIAGRLDPEGTGNILGPSVEVIGHFDPAGKRPRFAPYGAGVVARPLEVTVLTDGRHLKQKRLY